MNTANEIKIRPVILAGGFGTRLWPVSSDNCPKQFTQLVDEDSLFHLTLERVNDRTRYASPLIIGNIEHIFFITAALSRLSISDATVILEPCARNTAAAAIIAALSEQEENILHLVLPADHSIKDESAFHTAISQSIATAQKETIVLFGMKPKYPATGYGYIMPGKALNGSGLQEISIFSEKPNETFARVLINQGALWNSGILLYAPRVLCEEVQMLAPKHYERCAEALKYAGHDRKCTILREQEYALLESHALDTLIIEKTSRGAVLPCAMEWNDVGSWHSLWHMAEKDENGNALIGSVVTDNVSNSYIHSDGMHVAAVGLQDYLVIASNDQVLVAPYAYAQDIRQLYETSRLKIPNENTRPWGMYKCLSKGKNFVVKQITIWPGCAISLQTHMHRAEHWVVISGKAVATCDGVDTTVDENESIYIPKGAKHRLRNAGNTDLTIIEVQSGHYIGEDDITRYEDSYGRV